MKRILFFALLAGFLGFTACKLPPTDPEPCTDPSARPTANFTMTNGGCDAPCDVVFTNTSIDAEAYEWDFGDGSAPVTQGNPTHKYELPGDYNVKLTATSSCGTDIQIMSLLVKTQTFKKTFGGTSWDEGNSVQQTLDGGYILLGVAGNQEAGNLIKTDHSGNLVWEKNFGSPNQYFGSSVQQTSDGGYILMGHSLEGISYDIVLIKTDNIGNLIWKKVFGDTFRDYGYSVQQTSDGAYILLGGIEHGSSIYLNLMKTDNLGNLVWMKTFEGGDSAHGHHSAQQTSDGGYIIVGSTYNTSSGNEDVYLIKTDNIGNLVWEKIFGGAHNDYGYSVKQTPDGGYILLGGTWSEGAGLSDVYLIKTDNIGTVIWKRTFGAANLDEGYAVQQTVDGGYILLGSTSSEGAGASDFYLIKTDNLGNLVWKKTFGGANQEVGFSVQQTTDGGYILLGTTFSFGAGNADFYLIKTDKDGNAQ